MRITYGMSAGNSLRNIELNSERMATFEAQLTSQSRISKPSDDPIGAARSMGFQQSIDQSNQYLKNIDQGTNMLNGTDAALNAVTADMNRARELTVQAANGTLTASDQSAILAEVKQLQQSVLDLSNSKVGSTYLFSGTKSDAPGYVQALSSAATPAAYHGNAGQIQREVTPGVTVSVNADAQATFDPIFQALSTLESGLTTGNTAALQQSLGEMGTALDAVNVSRAGVGARMNRLETLQGQQTAVNTNLMGLLSQVKDVDMAQAITSFSQAQTVYQASLKSAAQSLQPSLLDFLK